MHLCFLDDSAQDAPTRDGMTPVVATGGVIVPAAAARGLAESIDSICSEYEFPAGEEFKWSPGRELWMRENLVEANRTAFYLKVLEACSEVGVEAIVVVSETTASPATGSDRTPQFDSLVMCLERINAHLASHGSHGVIIVDEPSGGSRERAALLTDCRELVREGTGWVDFDSFATEVLATDSRLSRLAQVADVVTSCTTQYVSGESTYSPEVFAGILPVMRRDFGCVGGRGLKLHPDFRLANLYHWLAGDTDFVRHQGSTPLPMPNRPYSDSADSYHPVDGANR